MRGFTIVAVLLVAGATAHAADGMLGNQPFRPGQEAVLPGPAFLPARPVVVPHAPVGGCCASPCCGLTNTKPTCSCDQPGFLRCIFASSHAFFPFATGHGFCGICP